MVSSMGRPVTGAVQVSWTDQSMGHLGSSIVVITCYLTVVNLRILSLMV